MRSSLDSCLVDISDLTVSYGSVRALDQLSLRIPAQGVFGLLGRNGAGKTTTIRAILGLVEPDSGRVLVAGVDPLSDRSVRYRISVLFSEDGLVPSLSVGENLSVWADLYGCGSTEAVSSILAKLDIDSMKEQRVKDLSTGNRRIIALARTFMLDADIYMLDEPTSSLDPVKADEVRRMISVLAGSRLVLLSTHNLHEAEELCSQIAIIDSGRLVITGQPGEIGADGGRYLVRCDSSQLLFRGRNLPPERDGHVLLESDDPPADLLAELVDAGNRITEFRPLKRSLSDVFIRLTGGEE